VNASKNSKPTGGARPRATAGKGKAGAEERGDSGPPRHLTPRHSLYDSHVASLLDEAVYHAEHLRLGATERSTHVS